MTLFLKGFRLLKMARRIGVRRVMSVVLRLPAYFRLYTRLLKDTRVPITAKLLLAGAIAYVLSPLDFIPDFIPFLGELDDLAILLAAGNRFHAMCPEYVVREHQAACGLFQAIPIPVG